MQQITKVPHDMYEIIKKAVGEEFKSLAECLWLSKGIRSEIESIFMKCIEKESKNLCSSNASPFKVSNIDDVKQFSLNKQKEELREKAPLLWRVLKAATTNRRATQRNTVKTEESIEPALLSAAGILLHCHNERMNMNATINAIICFSPFLLRKALVIGSARFESDLPTESEKSSRNRK
jgi:hypothetical protein